MEKVLLDPQSYIVKQSPLLVPIVIPIKQQDVAKLTDKKQIIAEV